MKKVFLLHLALLVFTVYSCNNDDDSIASTRLIVNHYESTTLGAFFSAPSTTLLIQTGDDIGSENFEPAPSTIEGFEYKLGFIHELEVLITEIENPPADAPNVKITLLNVISKNPVNADTEFKVRLTQDLQGVEFINWIVADGNEYKILNSSITISCGTLCEELSQKANNKEQLTGVFTHGKDNEYVLKQILNE